MLYNIYTSDQPTTPNTLVADYADDKVIISSSPDPIIASTNLQNHLSLMEDWSNLGLKRVSNDLEEVDSALNNANFTNIDDDTIIVNDTTPSASNSVNTEKSKSRKRRYITKNCGSGVDRECNYERTEEIHQALALLIAMNQLPISFCSSPGFCQFMAVVEPNYKICRDEAIKKRLHSLKSKVEEKIKSELRNVKSLVCTTDGWSSMAQNSYISLTAHIINDQWISKTFTLATQVMEERHTAVNLAQKLICIFDDWEISGKVSTVITDNAKNVVNAVNLLPLTIDNEDMDVTCAAHSLQLAIKTALKYETFSELIKQCSALVGHFKHSNVAKQSLIKKQEQLGIANQSLVQYCKTRWNSIYLMLDRLLQNRTPISNVLTDRTVTLLKPLYIVTNLFCSENHSPASMVRPLLTQLMDNHLKEKENDDENITNFKHPRYKDLEFEPIGAREKIRKVVQDLLEKFRTQNINLEQEPPVQRSDLEFLYGNIITDNNDISVQFQNYIAEPQLRFDLNSFEWWKLRENKYPALAELAKQYLAIPATSVSSERCFSTAGNIVTSKRTCLLTKNVNMLIFLYQNRKLLH
ncbi:hypothetical protein QTP88_017336 [Uroleucon formosanum]